MTREEAIQLINEIASSYYPCDKKDALEMAIKALEQQDRIIQILDDYDLEAWEILEMIKEVVRV